MKVSVEMVTYNHERFIAQAIESALMQQVDFDYEIVIGEDASTDNTRDIVIGYQRRNPDKIRLLLPEKNLGGHKNAIQTHKACQGEYIALLDGDDYWTSPHKLQKQVDFLHSHPEYAMCFHDAMTFYEDRTRESHSYCPANQKEISTLEDLLVENFIPTCSVMFRRGLFDEFPDCFNTLKMGDWPLHILNAQHGKIGYINEVMGAYRVHRGGVWSRLNAIQAFQAYIEFLDKMNTYLDFKYESIIRPRVLKCWDDLAVILVEQGIQRGLAQAAPGSIMGIFDDWPNELPLPNVWSSKVLKKTYAGLLFESYKARDIPKVRYYWIKTVRFDPSWLRNRGVWSIGLEAFLGQRFTGWLRRGARRVCRS